MQLTWFGKHSCRLFHSYLARPLSGGRAHSRGGIGGAGERVEREGASGLDNSSVASIVRAGEKGVTSPAAGKHQRAPQAA